jgi:hypothetical protein
MSQTSAARAQKVKSAAPAVDPEGFLCWRSALSFSGPAQVEAIGEFFSQKSELKKRLLRKSPSRNMTTLCPENDRLSPFPKKTRNARRNKFDRVFLG